MWIGYFIEWVEEIILIFNTLLLTQWVAISRTMFFPSALDPLLPPCALLLLPLLFSISGRSTLMFPCHCAFLFKAATSSSSSPFFISRPPLPRPASPILFFGRQQHQLLRCFSSLIFLNSIAIADHHHLLSRTTSSASSRLSLCMSCCPLYHPHPRAKTSKPASSPSPIFASACYSSCPFFLFESFWLVCCLLVVADACGYCLPTAWGGCPSSFHRKHQLFFNNSSPPHSSCYCYIWSVLTEPLQPELLLLPSVLLVIDAFVSDQSCHCPRLKRWPTWEG